MHDIEKLAHHGYGQYGKESEGIPGRDSEKSALVGRRAGPIPHHRAQPVRQRTVR
ncbi:MAG: hypothetical protein V4500_11555 [Pseudomonadota bacterium]